MKRINAPDMGRVTTNDPPASASWVFNWSLEALAPAWSLPDLFWTEGLVCVSSWHEPLRATRRFGPGRCSSGDADVTRGHLTISTINGSGFKGFLRNARGANGLRSNVIRIKRFKYELGLHLMLDRVG